MGSRDLAVATAVAAATVTASGVAAAGPDREGRVVRVPRPPLTLAASVRLCSVQEEGLATCDRPVRAGEIGTVVDDYGHQGTVTMLRVEPQHDCGVPVQWKVALARTGGDADVPQSGMIVLDLEVAPRARRLDPDASPREGEQVLQVLDRDGDGDGDLRTSHYSCDERGVIDPTPRPRHRCTDYWLAVRGRWLRARTDRLPVCER